MGHVVAKMNTLPAWWWWCLVVSDVLVCCVVVVAHQLSDTLVIYFACHLTSSTVQKWVSTFRDVGVSHGCKAW